MEAYRRIDVISKLSELASENPEMIPDIDYMIQNLYMYRPTDMIVSYAEYKLYTELKMKIVAIQSFKERNNLDLKQTKAILDTCVRYETRHLNQALIKDILECPENYLSGAIDHPSSVNYNVTRSEYDSYKEGGRTNAIKSYMDRTHTTVEQAKQIMEECMRTEYRHIGTKVKEILESIRGDE